MKNEDVNSTKKNSNNNLSRAKSLTIKESRQKSKAKSKLKRAKSNNNIKSNFKIEHSFTTKGKTCLIVDDIYLFRLKNDYKDGSKQFVCCHERSENCKASIILKEDDSIIFSNSRHSHEGDSADSNIIFYN